MGLFGKNKADGTVGRRNESSAAPAVLNHPSLGEVAVVRNPRARRVSVSVRPPGVVRLTLPPCVSLAEGVKFLDIKREWIAKARERMRAKSAPGPVLPPYATRRHTLELRTGDIDRIRVRVGDGRILVTHPAGLPPVAEPVQNAIKKGIEEAWRIEARSLLPPRVAELARAHGFRYRSVAVRNTVSKWGSCSARDDLSLSLHLMRLPDPLIDYIILHELCHTVHRNHGRGFHELLDRHTAGHHARLRKELRAYQTRW